MKKTWRIENLDCPNCAAKLERALSALPGVEAASVNFVNKTVSITAGEKDFAAVEQAVKAETARVEPEAQLVEDAHEHHHHDHDHDHD
ncbi:MAG: cation transporter, partial [Oscillospiraceae bacterium]|nr:cation transporter [Oscillospiraceae bacterium]